MLGHHNKQNDSTCEEINYLTLIWLLFKDFRCHISWCANYRSVEAATVSSLKWTCEAEIYDFDIVILIKQDVLGFQVTVGETL